MSTKLWIPIVAGAAIAAGVAYLFTTEEGEELRGKFADVINDHFPDASEHFAALKDKFMDQLKQS